MMDKIIIGVEKSSSQSGANEEPFHADKNFLTDAYFQQLKAPDPIRYFRDITSLENPKLPFLMGGELFNSISPEQFFGFCHAFADGMEYVRQKFGTQPAAITILDDKQYAAYSMPDTLTVHISRHFIAQKIQRPVGQETKASPFVLNAKEVAFLAGVEEAFHAHQARIDPLGHDRLKVYPS